MRKHSFLRSPSLWLLICGVALLACSNVNTSFGFLVFLAGAGAIALAWILLLLHMCKRDDLSQKSKRIWRTVRTVTFTAFALCLALFLVVEGLIIAGAKDVPAEGTRTLIVLGAGIRGTQPSATLRSRLELAEAYLHANPDCVVIVSGGQGRDEQVSEASVMASYLRQRGISSDRIFSEERSHNTRENLLYSQQIMEEHGLSYPVTVASNSFHLFRVRHLAKTLKLPSIGTLGAPLPLRWLVPGTYVREFGSVILMLLRDIF